jgi:DNA-binding transcriptional regulator YhcF (GntR family)
VRTEPVDGRSAQIADVLRRRILAGVHTGVLATGDRLPSVRDVAAELRIGGRVALAAYRALAGQGLVQVRSRSGIFVRDARAVPPGPLPEVVSWTVEATLRGLERGVPPAELHHQLRRCLDTTRVRVVCLECNHDQIHSLCRQLRDDYGFDPVGIELSTLSGGRRLPKEAAEADLVLTTRFHVPEAEQLGRRLRRPVLVATLDPVFVTTVRGLLERGRVFWICTDPRFEAKLPQILPDCPINPLVLGRDPLDAIPPEAMVYATLRASESLPRGWRSGGVVTVRRSFSSQTARALVLFGICKNLKVADIRSRRRS